MSNRKFFIMVFPFVVRSTYGSRHKQFAHTESKHEKDRKCEKINHSVNTSDNKRDILLPNYIKSA
jgi:hypothetical protein